VNNEAERSVDENIDAMTEAEAKESLRDFARENRRLRTILDGVAKSGAGVGAIVEVYVSNEGMTTSVGVAVCRADVDEIAFAKSLNDGLAGLAAVLGGVMDETTVTLKGVTAEKVRR
jgi:hypothetical protein